LPERYLGRTLGKYQVEALLGSGGFAWVYRAYDPDLDVPVALKVLKPQFAGDPAFEERFRREASTAAKLRHPNIITIFAVGRDGEAVYFAMDYLPQGLTDRLEVMSALPPAVVVQLARDVADALAFAHRQGVVHRDIKPDNILFDDHGNAVVADFGIASAVAGHAAETGTQLVVGTPQYFAPEQARGRPLDGRADLYALGVTLYRCATGVLPFPGEDWYEIAKRHVEEEPADVRTHNPALPPELARIVHRLLEKDPADRYQTAEELLEALATLQLTEDSGAGRTIAVPALDRIWSSTGMTARRRRLRRRVLWTVGAGAAAGLAIVAVGVALQDELPAGVAPALATDSLRPPGTVPPRLDSVVVMAADSGPASPRTPEPTTGILTVSAPAEARLFLDGREVGTGSWRGAAVPAGRHVVAAELEVPAGCSVGRIERSVTVTAGETIPVRLSPKSCGRLDVSVVINERPLTADRSAMYRLTGNGLDREGPLPLGAALVLPEGSYNLKVMVPGCSTVDGSVAIHAGAVERPRIAPICP
jgi:serine/threonine-protein kinase